LDFTYGVLFHPERSGAVGLRIPANFIDLLLSWGKPGQEFPSPGITTHCPRRHKTGCPLPG